MVVPEPMQTLFSSGRFNRVPIINGTCRDEFYWFQGLAELATGRTVAAETYPRALEASLQLIPPELLGSSPGVAALPDILARCPVTKYQSPSSALAAAIGDCGLICNGGRRVTRLIKRYVNDVHAFEFNVPYSPSRWPAASFSYEATHTIELQYLFPGFRGGSGISQPLSEAQKRLAGQMAQYWTTFSRLDTPNAEVPQAPIWPVHDPTASCHCKLPKPFRWQVLASDVTAISGMASWMTELPAAAGALPKSSAPPVDPRLPPTRPGGRSRSRRSGGVPVRLCRVIATGLPALH